MNTHSILVTVKHGEEKKQVVLTPVYPSSTIYNINIDMLDHGQVRKSGKEWKVWLNNGSWLDAESRRSIERAIYNIENSD